MTGCGGRISRAHCLACGRSWEAAVLPLLQFCSLCHSLSMRQVTTQRHKLPIISSSSSKHILCSHVTTSIAVNHRLLKRNIIHYICSPTWFLEVYILARYKIMSGQVSTHDNVYSSQLYNAAPLGNWANQSLPYSLIMPSTWLGNDKYQFLSHRFKCDGDRWGPVRWYQIQSVRETPSESPIV